MQTPLRHWCVPRAINTGRHQRSGFATGPQFDLEWELRPDPAFESLSISLASGISASPDHVPRFTHVRQGIEDTCRDMLALGKRICCGRLEFTRFWLNERWCGEPTLRGIGRYGVGSQLFGEVLDNRFASEAEQQRSAEATRQRFAQLCRLLPAAPSEWLTADVVRLTRSMSEGLQRDTLRVLADALEDAGCDDALTLEHLRTCRDHSPSCWVVEQLLAGIAESRPTADR